MLTLLTITRYPILLRPWLRQTVLALFREYTDWRAAADGYQPDPAAAFTPILQEQHENEQGEKEKES